MKTSSFIIASAFLLFSSPVFAKDIHNLTVTQVAVNPGSVPHGASRVIVDKLTLTASCSGPVTARTITVHHAGLGALTDIAKVYVMEKGTRLSRASVLQNPKGIALLRIPGFQLKPCESRVLDIAMDLSPTAATGGEHALSILSATDITTDATVTLQSKTSAATSIAPVSRGTVSYTDVPLSSKNVLFGRGRTLLRFSLKADAESNQVIDAITFTNEGKATDKDLQNLAIFTSNGEQVSATAASMNASTVRITFPTPLLLQKNAQRLFTLRGDVTASRRRTIELTVEETSDIEAHTDLRR